MSEIRIPNAETKQYARADRGEVFGSLWETKSVDLTTNPGHITNSPLAQVAFSDDDDADFELPVKFIRSDADATDRLWALTQANGSAVNDGLMFKANSTSVNGTWAQDAIANTPTDAVDDMEIFGQASSRDRLVVSRATNLTLMNNGTWTASWWQGTLAQAALTSGVPHMLHTFLNFLSVTDGNKLHTIDDSLVVKNTRITLPTEYRIRWTADDGIFMYMGTENLRTREAYVFPWDGVSPTYDEPIVIGDYRSFCGKSDNNGIMHIVNGLGQLMRFNGKAFDVVAELPCANSYYRLASNAIHANGIDIVGGNLHFLLNAGLNGVADTNLLDNMRSGIWEYTPKTGLNHKYSPRRMTTTDQPSAFAYGGALINLGTDDGKYAAGYVIYTDNASTTKKTLQFSTEKSTDGPIYGHFITPYLEASKASAFWRRLKMACKDFEDSTNAIVVKYRVSRKKAFEDSLVNRRVGVTWTSTTTFTTTDADIANLTTGDEVEVFLGVGAGRTFHVVSVSDPSGGTYTVTIDEVNTGATSTGQIFMENWTKAGTMSGLAAKKKDFRVAKYNKWVQFKVEVRGSETSPEIYEMLAEFENKTK